jgi:16S rRNA processing protein RimM
MEQTASFTIGRVTGVHGLNGNLKVWSYAQSADTFCSGKIVLLQMKEEQDREFKILSAKAHQKGILLLLEGVDNRDSAQTLVGCDILISRDQLPEPEEDSWYWQDLLGLDVHDDYKGDLGQVTDIFPTGANDVLVVTRTGRDGSTKETLIPMHRHFVTAVDLDDHILRTRLPEDYE